MGIKSADASLFQTAVLSAAKNLEAKKEWIKKHLKSVLFEKFYVVPYGTPKQKVCNFSNGFLFDDEKKNRVEWSGRAFDEKNILGILKDLY